MTNHYTSYSVSKALWEAGIGFAHTAVYGTKDKKLFDNAWVANVNWHVTNYYPAYTLGELFRELQKYGDREISIDLNPGGEVWIHADDYCMPLWKSDDPIEDTVGMALLALIEISSGDRVIGCERSDATRKGEEE